MKNYILLLICLVASLGYSQTVFINEIHYDNDGLDVGEAIEIAGPAGTDLGGWALILYDGATGLSYRVILLANTIPNQDNGYGTLSFPAIGMQNGAPDGIALVDGFGALIQFLSYEGTFTGASGPASGITSQDIGVTETGNTPVGFSLQLTGIGTQYGDFSWNSAVANTANAVNTNQQFGIPTSTCALAAPINCGQTISGNNSGGSLPPGGITSCGTNIQGVGAWYRYDSTSTGTITASTCGGTANFDTKLSIFSNTCGALVCRGGNDDSGCPNNLSEVTINVVANETYFIYVHGFNGQTGNFDLSLACGPLAICQGAFTVPLDANGQVNLTAADIDNGSLSPNGIASLSISPNSFDCSNIGVNNVTLTVTDNLGETDTCITQVTIEDVTNPTVNTVANFDAFLDVNGQATIMESDIDMGSSDNCSINTLTLDVTQFDCTNLGLNNVVLTATDPSGNSASANAVVAVLDAIAPTVVTQNINVTLDASSQATIVASDIDNGSTDNCGIVLFSLDVTSFDCSNLGQNTVTLSAFDASDNVGSATAVVVVIDAEAPVVAVQDVTLQLDGNGEAFLGTGDVNNGTTENCGFFTESISQDFFTCNDIGQNTITYTATDGSGNNASATAVITIEDVTAPIVAVQDITVFLDANGEVTVTPADVDNGTADNCISFTESISQTTFDCNDIGQNTITYTATDGSGNSSSATAVITIEDNTAPTLIVQDVTITLDANGDASTTSGDVDNGTADNCGSFTAVLDQEDFTCDDIGQNTVTFTATDTNGNSASATAVITVEDTETPIAIGQDITIDLMGNPSISIVPSDVDNGSSDNCDITLSIDVDTFTSAGTFPVLLTATDTSGNANTVTVSVTVLNTLSIPDFDSALDLKLYPIPTKDIVFVEGNIEVYNMILFDLSGRRVLESEMKDSYFSMRDLPVGIYFVRFNTELGSVTKRIIKE